MIETKVKQLGADEHSIEVRVKQEEYDRIFQEHLRRLASEVRLPGFRPGKAPKALLIQKFGDRLHQDTISSIIREYYEKAIVASGLKPAIQPELEIPSDQPESGFDFKLRVVTWPKVELKPLASLKIDKYEIHVDEKDVDEVIEHLMEKHRRYVEEEGRKAKQGDELRIDFTGHRNGEPIEGASGKDVAFVLGEGRFVQGFEDALVGASAQERRSFTIHFPENYPARELAGQDVTFDVKVKRVAKPVPLKDTTELAELLGFENVEALKNDIRRRLEQEAREISEEETEASVFKALLSHHEVHLPEPLVRQEMNEMARRLFESMRERGERPDPKIFQDEQVQRNLRERSERNLKIGLLLQSIREAIGIEVSDEELESEIERMAEQYPQEERSAFLAWLRSSKERTEALKDRLLQKKCIEHVLANTNVNVKRMSLHAWRQAKNAREDQA